MCSGAGTYEVFKKRGHTHSEAPLQAKKDNVTA